MNLNGSELTNSQRHILRVAVHEQLTRLQDNVGRATTDISGEYCREQVRQCQGLLTIVTESTTCDATAER